MYLSVSAFRPSAITFDDVAVRIFTPFDTRQVVDLLRVEGVSVNLLKGPFVEDSDKPDSSVSRLDNSSDFVRVDPAPTTGSLITISASRTPIVTFTSGSPVLVW